MGKNKKGQKATELRTEKVNEVVNEPQTEEVKNQESVQSDPEEKDITPEGGEQVKIEIPPYAIPTYKTVQVLFAKDLDAVDSEIEGNKDLERPSVKALVESFGTARFTRIAKTKAIVTAEAADMDGLSKILTDSLKRGVMITAL